jgi:hypothetical protein
MSCFRVCGVFRGSLLFGDKVEDVVAEGHTVSIAEVRKFLVLANDA